MKYIKEFKDIDWDDWDEEEIDPQQKFKIGDIPRLKQDATYYYRTISDHLINDTVIRKIREEYFLSNNKENKYPISNIRKINGKEYLHFKDPKLFWYDSSYWEV